MIHLAHLHAVDKIKIALGVEGNPGRRDAFGYGRNPVIVQARTIGVIARHCGDDLSDSRAGQHYDAGNQSDKQDSHFPPGALA